MGWGNPGYWGGHPQMKSFGLVLVLPKVGAAFSGQASVPTAGVAAGAVGWLQPRESLSSHKLIFLTSHRGNNSKAFSKPSQVHDSQDSLLAY